MLLVVRKRYAEALVLVVGLALVYVAVHVTKDALARERPGGSLVDTSGDAYPSGHAAYATAWIAVAVALTRRLRLVTSGVLVFIALGIAAAVGVSRVYLRAHWWSDVAGGWGLGVGDIRDARGDRARRRVHPPQWGRAGGRIPRIRGRARDAMSNLDLSSTEIVIALASALVLVCYVVLIVAAGGALLRPRLGEAGRRRPHAVRARHAARHRRGDRLRDRLDLRHLRG